MRENQVTLHGDRYDDRQRACADRQSLFSGSERRAIASGLRGKGLQIFGLIDHNGEAEKVCLKMPPTKVLIFGSPEAGTPLIDRGSQPGHRSSLESAGCRGCPRQSLDHLPQPGLSAGPAWSSGGLDQESCRRRGFDCQGCGIMLAQRRHGRESQCESKPGAGSPRQ